MESLNFTYHLFPKKIRVRNVPNIYFWGVITYYFGPGYTRKPHWLKLRKPIFIGLHYEIKKKGVILVVTM